MSESLDEEAGLRVPGGGGGYSGATWARGRGSLWGKGGSGGAGRAPGGGGGGGRPDKCCSDAPPALPRPAVEKGCRTGGGRRRRGGGGGSGHGLALRGWGGGGDGSPGSST